MMNFLLATLGPFKTVGMQGDGDESIGGVQQRYMSTGAADSFGSSVPV